MSKKNTMILIAFVLMVVVIILITGCRRTDHELPAQEPVPEEIVEETNETPMVDDEEKDQDNQYYVLYLKHKDQAFIFSDTYHIKADDPKLEGKSMAEFVIEELIKQKGVGELINPIHPKTEILSLEQNGRTVTLNLSQDFADGLTGTAADTEATIAMVVNTLITLPSIDRVSLLIEGVKPDTINGLAIQEIYGFITEYYPDK